MKGKIRSMLKEKNYGFIVDGKSPASYFFHASECLTPFDTLEVGDEVKFEFEQGQKGLRAYEVERI